MRLPVIQGTIRRRILVNFRVDPETMQRQLPTVFKPKLHKGYAVAGICLIRLEHIRPKIVPEFIGLSSENAAHRIAVEWEDHGSLREGVFICRRDTDSEINHLTGGRVFPGEHHKAVFDIRESGNEINLKMISKDRSVRVEVEGETANALPQSSVFGALDESSSFFEGGSVGYSVTTEPNRLDGLRLETKAWRVDPLNISDVFSSYFSDEEIFPEGSAEFDHALIMRDISHEWHAEVDLHL